MFLFLPRDSLYTRFSKETLKGGDNGLRCSWKNGSKEKVDYFAQIQEGCSEEAQDDKDL